MSDIPKVLIADDDPTCIDFVQMSLADMPCEVLVAEDGQQALAVAREHRPQVIILDIQMPELNGFDVFSALRRDRNLAAIPVIMLTAIGDRTGFHFDESEMDEFMGSAPQAYLEKPVDPEVLKHTVSRLLSR